MHALSPRIVRARLRPGRGGILRLRDGRTALVRSVRPDDAEAVQRFVRALSPAARRRRFFGAIAELSPGQLDRLTVVRDPRDASLVALSAHAGEPRIVGLAQYASDGALAAEFALVVADDWQGQGLGARLLGMLLARAAEAGLRTMTGSVLAENGPMLALAAHLGFAVSPGGDRHVVNVAQPLPPARRAAGLAHWLRELLATRLPVVLTAPTVVAAPRG
jgi:acetyltransferase